MIVLLRNGAADEATERIEGLVGRAQDRAPVRGRVNGVSLLRFPGVRLDEPELSRVLAQPEVARVIGEDLPYLLASREFHPENTLVRVGDAVFGGREALLVAGPCSVESEDQLRRCAEAVREAGGRILRGGAYKPRTSPYAFQGLGENGLDLLARVGEEFELAIVTEVMAPEHVPVVAERAQMLQIGSRSVQNFPLLEAVGEQKVPVLLKRGMMSTLDEFLGSAEYILARGNDQVVLCERGIRSFDAATRNLFDVVSIPLLKKMTHLPVIGDPSHGTGRRDLVSAAARAAIAAGADGLIVESHPQPSAALSDSAQALPTEELAALSREVGRVAAAIDRSLGAV